MKRRLVALLSVMIVLLASSSWAQERPANFPDTPVELVAYTDPGTSVDRMLRSLAPLMQEVVGQPVVVVNRPGGNTANAMSYVNRRPADGTTILGHTTTFSSVAAQGVSGISGDDVNYLCSMVEAPMAVTVNADSPYKTIDDLVTAAKESGGQIKASGGAGAGTYTRMFAIAFGEKAGIDFTWVPFRSSKGGRRALVAGDLDFLFTSPGAVKGARMLAVTSSKRFFRAPDTPTLAELGYDIGNRVAWRGMMVKQGTPPETQAYLIEVLKKVAESDTWRQFVAKDLKSESVISCGQAFEKATLAEIEETKVQYRRIGIID